MRNRTGWEPIFEIHDGDNIVPFDVLKPSHRLEIKEAFSWIQRLASTRGSEENESF